ncbi:MAG TPA: aspartyl protease family protein [Polyangia bacterium]|nr:aspartyl protease family protein [Polyangia bacterium]
MKLRLRASGLALALLVTGFGPLSCGGSSSGGISTMGMLGEPSTALISGNLIFVNASMNAMDENPGLFGMLIDSGSPVVLIDPTLFGGSGPTSASQIPTTVNLGLLDAAGNPVVIIDNTPVLQVTTKMMTALGFGGILGGNVMQKFSVQLDYSAPMMEGFCLGCKAGGNPNVQSPGGLVSFTLKGGGHSPVTLGVTAGGTPINSPVIDIPPTRIPVTVNIDGTDHPFIVDTGATEVSLRSTVYSQLVSDGRAQLQSGIAIMTIAGASNASLTRAKTITVGGETVTNVPVMTIMSTPADQLLNGISSELGTQIDGLLGGSFLRNFLVTIDYPAGQLHLDPYLTPPIADEFRRVGFTIGLDATGANFVVQSVYPNTDAAAKGVMVGDQITAIDGKSLASVGYVADADALLDGTPGTTKQITFGAKTGTASLANMTVAIQVDDLIPNPQ